MATNGKSAHPLEETTIFGGAPAGRLSAYLRAYRKGGPGAYRRNVNSAVASLPEVLHPTDGGRASRDHRMLIPRVGDVGFAPVRAEDRVCLSRAGRWRARHVYTGGVCCFCDGSEA